MLTSILPGLLPGLLSGFLAATCTANPPSAKPPGPGVDPGAHGLDRVAHIQDDSKTPTQEPTAPPGGIGDPVPEFGEAQWHHLPPTPFETLRGKTVLVDVFRTW